VPRGRQLFVAFVAIIRARNSWIGGRALPQLKCRAGNDRCEARGSAETHLLAADRCALHLPGAAYAVQALSKSAALLDGGPTIRNDDTGCGGAATVALVSAGLSQDAGRRRQNAQ
jgi:hypothetical protein